MLCWQRPDLCRRPYLQLLLFRSCLPGNDEFFPLLSNRNLSGADPCWKTSSAACGLVQEYRTPAPPAPTQSHTWWVVVWPRWGGVGGEERVLHWSGRACDAGVEDTSVGNGPWDESLGSFCLTQLVLESDRSYSRPCGTKVSKVVKSIVNLFMTAPPGILLEAPGPQSSVLSSRSSSC